MGELRSGVDADTDPSHLTVKQVTRLHQLMHEAKFRDPSGSHLSPAGVPANPAPSACIIMNALALPSPSLRILTYWHARQFAKIACPYVALRLWSDVRRRVQPEAWHREGAGA